MVSGDRFVTDVPRDDMRHHLSLEAERSNPLILCLKLEIASSLSLLAKTFSSLFGQPPAGSFFDQAAVHVRPGSESGDTARPGPPAVAVRFCEVHRAESQSAGSPPH